MSVKHSSRQELLIDWGWIARPSSEDEYDCYCVRTVIKLVL